MINMRLWPLRYGMHHVVRAYAVYDVQYIFLAINFLRLLLRAPDFQLLRQVIQFRLVVNEG